MKIWKYENMKIEYCCIVSLLISGLEYQYLYMIMDFVLVIIRERKLKIKWTKVFEERMLCNLKPELIRN